MHSKRTQASRRVRIRSWKLDDKLREADDWGEHHFAGLDVGALQGTVRAAAGFGRDSFDCFGRVPLLASRQDQPGVAERCLQQYDDAPRHAHDPASHFLFEDTEGSLRQSVLAIAADGNIPCAHLRREVSPFIKCV